MGDEPAGRGESAIVRPSAAAQHIDVRRVVPSERWQPFIGYQWIVRWECPEPFDQQVIPQPCEHVSAEMFEGRARLLVSGITREPFVRTLAGMGHALGAAFGPGSFRAVLGADVTAVSGRVVPFGDVVGPDDSAAATEILRADATDEQMVAAMEAHLSALDVIAAPNAEVINALVDTAERERSLIRAEQLVDLAGSACERFNGSSRHTSASGSTGSSSGSACSMRRPPPATARRPTGPPWPPSSGSATRPT